MPDLMTLVFGEADDFIPVGMDDDGGPSDVDGPLDPVEPAPDAWLCAMCGREVPKRRGRKPKRILCDDHQQTRTGSRPRQLSKEAKDEHRLKKISGDLQEGLGKITGTIVPFMPVTGTTIAMQGPNACDAVVQAATPFPRFLDGLEKAAMALPWITIAQFVMAVMVATQVDMNRIEPYGIAPEILGVTKAAQKAGWHAEPKHSAPPRADQVPYDRSSVHGFVAPQPPRFKM